MTSNGIDPYHSSMTVRLGWVPNFVARIGSAMGEGIESSTVDSVDPLKKIIRLKFQDEFPGSCWNPFQTLAHGYAEANDCVIHRARKRGKKELELEVLIKRLGGLPKAKDPILDKKRRKRGV